VVAPHATQITNRAESPATLRSVPADLMTPLPRAENSVECTPA
jgi:hypothetical protein